MSSSQAFCFARHFGVLVGDLVPSSDLSWHLYLCLVRLIDVALAKTVPKTVAVTFPVLVQELLYLYKKLGNNLKPKFHFLLHYAEVFKMSGPVANLSCIRPEGKHRQLKQSAVTNMSRIDLSYSVGVKHQLQLCSRFLANESIMPKLEIGSIQELSLFEHERYFEFLPTLPDTLRDVNEVLSPTWVNYKSTHYTKNMVLITDRDETLWWPVFSKIEFILMDGDLPLFICSKFQNIGFSDHYHGYEVENLDSYFCIQIENLIDSLPLYDLKTADGKRFVVMRYMI